MSKNFKSTTFLIILLLLLTGISMSIAADVPTITKEELKAQLDSSDVMILDVRKGKDWKSSEFKIKGAFRANPNDFDQWITQHAKDKRYVTYCA